MPIQQPHGLIHSASALEEVSMRDGGLLRSTVFTPDHVLALAIFIPGPATHWPQYLPVALTLARAGVLAVVPSLRVRGALVQEWLGTWAQDRPVRDVLALLTAAQREYPSLPILFGAHSTGCSVLLRALPEMSACLRGAFLVSPASEQHRHPGRIDASTKRDVRRLLARATLPIFAALVASDDDHGASEPEGASSLQLPGFRTLVNLAEEDPDDVLPSACTALRRWLFDLFDGREREAA